MDAAFKQRGTLFFLGGAITMAQTKVYITHGTAVGDRTVRREQRQNHGADSDLQQDKHEVMSCTQTWEDAAGRENQQNRKQCLDKSGSQQGHSIYAR